MFLAALSETELTKQDFLRLVSHNPVYAEVFFDGCVELGESRVPAGHMRQYMWRLQDKKITSNDITIVVMFNNTREKHPIDDFKFVHRRRADEIDMFVGRIAKTVSAEEIEMLTSDEGNLVYILRRCNTEPLSEQFSKHSRRQIKAV